MRHDQGTMRIRRGRASVEKQSWHANIRKRPIKLTKVYIRDSGLLHQLKDILP